LTRQQKAIGVAMGASNLTLLAGKGGIMTALCVEQHLNRNMQRRIPVFLGALGVLSEAGGYKLIGLRPTFRGVPPVAVRRSVLTAKTPRAPRNAIVMDSNQAGIIDVSRKQLDSNKRLTRKRIAVICR
jgi:hypothetical protein